MSGISAAAVDEIHVSLALLVTAANAVDVVCGGDLPAPVLDEFLV